MTTTPFVPPRLNLVKNENSMPTGPQPFVVKLEGLYKIENGRLVGKLEELKNTQEVIPNQVCQVNNSHFKINALNPIYTIHPTGITYNGLTSYTYEAMPGNVVNHSVYPYITFSPVGNGAGPGVGMMPVRVVNNISI